MNLKNLDTQTIEYKEQDKAALREIRKLKNKEKDISYIG